MKIVHEHIIRIEGFDELLKIASHINKKLDHMALTIADIQQRSAALQQAVAAETSVIESAIVLINGNNAVLVDIKKQLADAIAAGGTPEQLQAISDQLDATIAESVAKAQALAEAVAANTNAEKG